MKRLGKILNKLLHAPAALFLLLVPASAVLLVYSLGTEDANSFITYASYLLSSYTLAALCAGIPGFWVKARRLKEENRYLRRYFSDAGLRVEISLYISLAVNGAYVLMQVWLGITNRSFWFYALAVYYCLLGTMRFVLLRELRGNGFGKDVRAEYRKYRLCGCMLLLMNTALSAIAFFIVKENRGFEHHYIMTIGMAAYTFYSFTKAIINLVRYRKYKSPVMSASKAVGFVAALVSMLSLETAMFASFGEDDPALRLIITAATGGIICLTVLSMAIYMIVHSTFALRKGDTLHE